MGYGMAKNIRQKIPESSILIIYDINSAVLENFARAYGNGTNVKIAASPKEVSAQADVIMTSVPQARHVEMVFLDPQTGLLASPVNPDRRILFLELSTIDAGVSKKIAEEVTSRGVGDFLDAPCSV